MKVDLLTRVYFKNYELISKIIDLANLEQNSEVKLKPNITLSIEVLSKNSSELNLSITKYKLSNNDLIPNPEVIIRLYLAKTYIEALSYQDEFGFRSVYQNDGMMDIEARDEINQFLHRWLKSIIEEVKLD